MLNHTEQLMWPLQRFDPSHRHRAHGGEVINCQIDLPDEQSAMFLLNLIATSNAAIFRGAPPGTIRVARVSFNRRRAETPDVDEGESSRRRLIALVSLACVTELVDGPMDLASFDRLEWMVAEQERRHAVSDRTGEPAAR